ncbi:MAG: formylglycine-generating enzyme family protein [Acidobacteriota bacterium]
MCLGKSRPSIFIYTLILCLLTSVTNTTAQKTLGGNKGNSQTGKQVGKQLDSKPTGKPLDSSGSAKPKPLIETNVGKPLEAIILKRATQKDFKFINGIKQSEAAHRVPLNNTPKPKPTLPRKNNNGVEEEVFYPEYPEMVAIPPGDFEMGYDNGDSDEAPLHTIELSGFEIGKYEITNRQFRTFVKATGYRTKNQQEKKTSWEEYASLGRGNYPVVMIRWEDAMEYCQWLSKVTGETYRLPTEAEWEYAARGGNPNRLYPWGNHIDESRANYAAQIARLGESEQALSYLRTVGSYDPNEFGIYDIIGNVAEWCYDWYKEDYYQDSPTQDPMGPDSGLFIYRITRGGSWADPINFCRISFRNAATIPYNSASIGFRVVKIPKSNTQK